LTFSNASTTVIGGVDVNSSYILEDGSDIAVVGGGPTGSFFSIFALKMAKIVGKEIGVTIYEPKDFKKDGPLGCNRCGGIISELLVQTLAVEGITLPESLVQRGINSYKLHTSHGSVYIATPAHEKTIATVYRGGGPKGIIGRDKESFDNFLLSMALEEGAVHCRERIDRIDYSGKKPVLYSKNKKIQEPDLVVGAMGVKSSSPTLFEDMGFGYRRPETVTAAIAEISMHSGIISEHFGHSVNLFLLPVKDIKFAAMIPKGTYVTLCILGKKLDRNIMDEFINHAVVRNAMHAAQYEIACRCLPKMNIRAPQKPFADRVVVCGDAGSTRLFKDGLGAAYIMGKAAAKTAVFHGVGKSHFEKEYYPVYKSLITDNRYGKMLFEATDLLRHSSVLTKSMLEVVQMEQSERDNQRRLSSILWDMFTGNERYRNIFYRGVNIPLFFKLLKEIPFSLRNAISFMKNKG
jgi:flavin-dependent dehydrogenase